MFVLQIMFTLLLMGNSIYAAVRFEGKEVIADIDEAKTESKQPRSDDLFDAIRGRDHRAVQAILATIIDTELYKPNLEDKTPLIKAIEAQNPVIVDDILKARADIKRPDLEYSSSQHPGQTPLCYAVNSVINEANRAAIIKKLLDAGAFIGARERRAGRNPLHIAAQNSSDVVVQMFIDYLLISSNDKNRIRLVLQPDAYDRTPLTFAQQALEALRKTRDERAKPAAEAYANANRVAAEGGAARDLRDAADKLQDEVDDLDEKISTREAVIKILQDAMKQAR